MKYIKNLINNILYLLKHDILVNNMIKERRIERNHVDILSISSIINMIEKNMNTSKQRVKDLEVK